ncbi:sensor histidine kinase [Labilibaculum sp. K2S]|uniref:sensor histidine kinase n=1 Tax=Labilibaculum sp. K2S TaxID=3056386 RepID=UPI0025A33393|nr:sensor histidine kinase [Labilibaculum sp. K2S]MDM8158300.1 sensor histidine kinase [Labilibaculum sp. K2S]
MYSLILRNLINNAIKFSESKSQIEIDIQEKNDFLKVQITDHDIGIASENLDKLFRIDLKFKSTGTVGEKGTGLGLLLCKEFAKANKSTVWAESTIEKGSAFHLHIPRSK